MQSSGFIRGTTGKVLEAAALLDIATLTTAEEELGRVTVPARFFRDPSVYAVRFRFVVEAAANTDQKTPRVRIGSLAGSVLMNHSNDATSGNVFNFEADLLPLREGVLTGLGQSGRVTGASFTFVIVPVTGLDFDAEIPLLITGESASAAGNLILRAKRLETIFLI